MEESDFNVIFAKRLKSMMDMYGLTKTELARRLGVSITAVTNWLEAKKTPRMNKIDQMCAMFHCSRSDLISEIDFDTDNDETLKRLTAYAVRLGKMAPGVQRFVLRSIERMITDLEEEFETPDKD